MPESASLINQIKHPHSKVFRRLLVKRRQISDGLFEATWQDLSRYVIRWGIYSSSVDTPRFGDLIFDNAAVTVINIDGTFNPNDNTDSFWSGYGDLQRSLVRIEAGFTHQTQSTGGVWTNTEFPTSSTIFTGILSGDIYMSSRAELVLPLRPITQVFRDYPANDMLGWTAGGMTAGAWFGLMRDHTDGAGNFVFRPFIGTASAANDWTIASTGHVYADLYLNATNASDAHNIARMDCWAISQKLAEAEQYIAYVNRQGQFVWQSKTATAAVQYQFNGISSTERVYGQTIKRIESYGKRLTSFYSRVAVKFQDADTTLAFVNTALAFAVAGSNTAWNLGHRTFGIENFWIANSAAAGSVAASVFAEVSSQTEEIELTTTFIPHLNLLDRISVTYDATDFVTGRSLWDQNDWAADDTNTSQDLIWDDSRGDSIVLNAVNFKVLSISLDLDNLESRFIAKKL